MAEQDASVLLCAAGDVALGGVLQERLVDPQGRSAVIAQVRALFAEADLRFVDLDCTLDATGPPPRPDEYLVSASPEAAALLTELGIDVVSLANNHSTDHGGSSLARSMDSLRGRGLGVVGAGEDLAQARQPLVLLRHGVRVGFLAYASEHPWVGALAARADAAGVAPLRPQVMEQDVRRLRGEVDCVVVSVHWGKEYLHYPPPESVALARSLLAWGADLVLGHHPHVVQGMEERCGRAVLYSLGNFLYPDDDTQGLRFSGPGRHSLVALVRLSASGARVERLVPVGLRADGCLALLEGPEATSALAVVEDSSAAIQRADYARIWRRQVRRHEVQRLGRVLRQEIVEVGWLGAVRRLLRVRGKNLRSVGRSLAEIALPSPRREE